MGGLQKALHASNLFQLNTCKRLPCVYPSPLAIERLNYPDSRTLVKFPS